MTRILLLDLLILALYFTIGGLMVRWLLGKWDGLAIISLAFPMGSGLLTWCVFLAAWAGIPNLAWTMVALSVILLLGTWSLNRWVRISNLEGDRPGQEGRAAPRSKGAVILRWAGWGFFGLTLASAIVLSVARSYSTWDGIALWSVKGYGMINENSLYGAARWGAHGLDYPLNIPLTISFFRLASGDVLPGSKLIFPLYLLSLVIGVFRFWRRAGVDEGKALLGILALTSVPIIFEQATIGYGNLPMAGMVALGVLWGSEGVWYENLHAQAMASVLFGITSWTRPDGILFSIGGLLAILLGGHLLGRGRRKAWALLGPFCFIAGSWMLFYFFHGGEQSQAAKGAMAGLSSLSAGSFDLSALMMILRFAFSSAARIGTWGLLFPLTLVFLIWRFGKMPPAPRHFFWTCLMAGGIFGVIVVLSFYLGHFGYESNFLYGWLLRGFDRALIPAAILFLIGGVSSTALPQRVSVSKGS